MSPTTLTWPTDRSVVPATENPLAHSGHCVQIHGRTPGYLLGLRLSIQRLAVFL